MLRSKRRHFAAVAKARVIRLGRILPGYFGEIVADPRRLGLYVSTHCAIGETNNRMYRLSGTPNRKVHGTRVFEL